MTFPAVSLSEIAHPVVRQVAVVPGSRYRTIGVKWWGEGAYERATIDGSQTAAKTLTTVWENDLIINKIWVRHGSTAIATKAVDGCSASGEFPTFELDQTRVLPRWIHWLTKTRGFWSECDNLSRGTSGKNRIKPELFLTIKIPLPLLEQQRRIVARIEELAAKIEEARGLRLQATQDVERLVNNELDLRVKTFKKNYGYRWLGELILDANYGTSAKCDTQRNKGALPVLRIPNVASEQINFDNLKYGVLTGSEKGRASLKEGDILIVRTNGSADLIGRCAVVPRLKEQTAFASYLIRLQCDQSLIDPHYLQIMLKHLRTDGQLINFARTSAGQYNVSLGRLRAAQIPVPPISEQQLIVTSLNNFQSNVEAIKRLQAETATELDALMPATLDRAFKGEL